METNNRKIVSEPEQLAKIELTIDVLRTWYGFKNLSDDEAKQVLQDLEMLAEIVCDKAILFDDISQSYPLVDGKVY